MHLPTDGGYQTTAYVFPQGFQNVKLTLMASLPSLPAPIVSDHEVFLSQNVVVLQIYFCLALPFVAYVITLLTQTTSHIRITSLSLTCRLLEVSLSRVATQGKDYMHRDTQLMLQTTRKKRVVVELLDKLCQQIEITDSQYQTAKSRYEAIGAWLTSSISPYLQEAQIYPQGSIALGTTNKPIAGSEFDVDLVCHLPTLLIQSDLNAVKSIIGDRLKEHATYKQMLEEKQRCWRINYANEFHLDITPSILNPGCYQGGELVPDKSLMSWKPTNPKGYISMFERYAAITPSFDSAISLMTKAACDSIEPLPKQTTSKPILKRIIQILKRHRDHKFIGKWNADLAPISIIVTTLAGWAYGKCATQQTHSNAYDFMVAVIQEMPKFIRIENRSGLIHFMIENETTKGENFADKWNSNPQLATAFYEWHSEALIFTQSLMMLEGADSFSDSFTKNFGTKKDDIRQVLAGLTDPVNLARAEGRLAIAPALGVIVTPMGKAVSVPKNTFFGRPDE